MEVKEEMFQTLMFTPANHPRKVEKALTLPVDAIIIDLEDACAESEKEKARMEIPTYLNMVRSTKVYVRVNAISTRFFFNDMRTVVNNGLDGIILPMTEDPNDLTIADWLISSLEKETGLSEGSIDLIPIIETAKGVSNLKSILQNKKRVKRIAFGAADYANDTGTLWKSSGEELHYVRSSIVIESRAAKIEPPIDTVFADLENQEGLRQEAFVAKNIGFQGKFMIHPKQIDTIKAVFRPSDEEILRAIEIVEAFELAEKQGSSSIRVGNQFVDYPIVYKAKKTLEIANKLNLSKTIK